MSVVKTRPTKLISSNFSAFSSVFQKRKAGQKFRTSSCQNHRAKLLNLLLVSRKRLLRNLNHLRTTLSLNVIKSFSVSSRVNYKLQIAIRQNKNKSICRSSCYRERLLLIDLKTFFSHLCAIIMCLETTELRWSTGWLKL